MRGLIHPPARVSFRIAPFALAALMALPVRPIRGEGTVTNCTARELMAALRNGGLVQLTCSGTIPLTETLVISEDTIIDATGYNVTLSPGTNNFRLMRVMRGATVTVRHVTFSNGRAASGAALLNAGAVTLSSCTFQGNRAAGDNGLAGKNGEGDRGEDGRDGTAGEEGLGGALFNRGELIAENCDFSNNSATGGDGGAGGNGANGGLFGGIGGRGGNAGGSAGGAIYNLGQLTVKDCSFENNLATGGKGGAESAGGSGAFPGHGGNGGAGGDASGGAIFSSGTTAIRRSLFSGNSVTGGDSANSVNLKAGRAGGDASGGAFHSEGESSVVNSTFTANQSKGGKAGTGASGQFGEDGGRGGTAQGGGVATAGSRTSIRSCTFSTNSVTGGPGGAVGSGPTAGQSGQNGKNLGGNIAQAGGKLLLENSIVAYVGLGGNCAGTISDGGHNLSSDESCGFDASGSKNRVDPKLGPLQDNGGPTLTVGLLKKSPALDAGNDNDCPATDQRGVSRPQGQGCDIGAYERSATFEISGRVTDNGRGLSGITVVIEGKSVTTDTNGVFLFTEVLPGTFTVAALSSTIPLSPSQTVTVGPNAEQVNFNRTFGVTGRLTENSNAVAGITVQLGDLTATTGTNGVFSFSGLNPGSFNLSVTNGGIGFTPTNRVIVLGPDVSGADFTANRPRLGSTGVLTNGLFALSLQAIPGRNYNFESSTNLLNWTRISTVTADAAGGFIFSDSNSATLPFRFYRVTLP